MTLSAKAIITFETFLAFTGEDATKYTEPKKSRVELFINSASQEILNFLGLATLLTTTSLVEQFDGNGQTEYYPKNSPITAVSKLEYFIGNATWTEITTAQRARSFDANKVWFPDRYVFETETRFRMTYSYGYGQSSIPYDLQEACFKLARLKEKQNDRGAEVLSKSSQSESSRYDYELAKNEIFDSILTYKRSFIG